MAETRVVVIAVDGSEFSEKAFQWYCDKVKKDNDKVIFVHVIEPPSLPVLSFKSGLKPPTDEWGEIMKKQVEEEEKIEHEYTTVCISKKLNYKFQPVHSQSAGPGIVAEAQKCNAELLIMGTRGQNKVRRTILGSVSDYVLHHAGIPVAVVPPMKTE